MSRYSSPFKTPGASEKAPKETEEVLSRADMKNRLKSPQVLFQGPEKERNKHARSTPASGRGKLKKLRERVASKAAGQRLIKASPSHLVSRSMLSFDLHGGPLREDEIPGDSELFVKFVKDRRGSSGRGSLKELINKRIALQVGAKALAVRQVSDKPEKPPSPKPDKPKSKPQVTVIHKVSKSKELKAEQSRKESLEVPLAQEYSEPTVQVSQTQVLERNEDMTQQTQVLERNEEMTQTQVFERTPIRQSFENDLPFLPTPQVDILEPVLEESEQEKKNVRNRRIYNQFIDEEAEGSEDGSHGVSSCSESESDLSDLIASSPENEDSPGAHARLHAKWLREEEERRDLENTPPANARRRRNRVKVNLQLFQPMKKPQPKKKIEASHTVVEEKKKNFPPVAQRVKKYPHRRSSVSSACSEIDFRVGRQILNGKQRPSVAGPFSFIAAPSEEGLAKATAKLSANEEATSRAMAGASKLMGKKRFAFGG